MYEHRQEQRARDCGDLGSLVSYRWPLYKAVRLFCVGWRHVRALSICADAMVRIWRVSPPRHCGA